MNIAMKLLSVSLFLILTANLGLAYPAHGSIKFDVALENPPTNLYELDISQYDNSRSTYIDDPSITPKAKVAVIESGGMSARERDEIAGAIGRIYDQHKTTRNRGRAFYDKLRQVFPAYYPSVTINYEYLIYSSRYYYINLKAERDYVFAYGYKL